MNQHVPKKFEGFAKPETAMKYFDLDKVKTLVEQTNPMGSFQVAVGEELYNHVVEAVKKPTPCPCGCGIAVGIVVNNR